MHIPGYTILGELGQGGMATVYLARQDHLGRQVALKVMMPQDNANDEFTARFVKEGQIIAQLQHPQIVTIYDFNIINGQHYFSMEYLPGDTLAQRIARGLRLEETVSITRCIAQALTVAHHNGVIHRDIKPQNILFRTDGNPVLTDFGIARAVGTKVPQHTTVGMVVGSPRYMSPEQSMSRPIDARSDLYSLGVVFYEMLTGQLPYQAEDVVSLALKHCTAPLPVLTDDLRRYQPIVDKLLAKKPEDRFNSTSELIRELDGITTGTFTAIPDDERTVIRSRAVSEMVDLFKEESTEDDAKSPPLAWWQRRGNQVALGLSLTAILAAGGVTTMLIAPTDDSLATFIASLPTPAAQRGVITNDYETQALAQLRDGQFQRSLDTLTLGLSAAPTDARLLAIKQRVLAHMRVNQLLPQIEKNLADQRLDDSTQLIEEGLNLLPSQPQLLALRQQVQQRLQQRTASRATLAETSDLMAAGQLTAALALLDQKMAELGTEDQELSDLRTTLVKQLARETEQQLEVLRNQADQAARTGDFPAAVTALDAALQLRPGDAQLQQRRTELATRAQQMQAADLLTSARAAQAQQDWDQALDLVRQGLRAIPDHAELQTLQGELTAQFTNHVKVAKIVGEVAALQRDNQLATAVAVLDAALAQHPDDAKLLSLRGEMVSAQQVGEVKQRAELVRQASALLDDGHLEAATLLTKRGLELSPHHAPLLALQKQIDTRQALAVDVVKQLQRCAAQLPSASSEPSASIPAASAAATCYRAVLEQNAGNNDAREQLVKLRQMLATAFETALSNNALGDATQAVAGIEIIDPTDGRLVALRGQLAERQKLLPTMVDVAGDCFQMGSPDKEADREPDEQQHRVCIEPFELGRYEVSMAEFKRFVVATAYKTDAEQSGGEMQGCWAFDADVPTDNWGYHPWASWQRPDKSRTPDPNEPVTCVSWHDANAYLRWLNSSTGQHFRLPTEAEWEFATRAATSTSRFWGNNNKNSIACQYANVADTKHDWDAGFPCDDGYEWAAPVGRFLPNAWGLYDTLGNVLEWTCSEYDANYGVAHTTCTDPTTTTPIVLRGGAFNSGPGAMRSAYRNRNYPESRYNFVGFRLARDKR
ncbi:SUMF1/EgtB/PvdO family nonheme iron enzyme [Rhodoferax sp. 4810]|uniref:SUMF1/EgtB/PvdO family nonheme iron enzyme n=1 Tax=Thiospirillum jenense TaxID=1653858 RepID=A0A839H724_9GAMM|nr:SUMF1/EgtB/PvdO family nonheme iron enzyme [Thiospirillum jenense]MBB1073834.1 SUMF1/EgtB/PvdO family nonheme iron enzyme [Rhodoferax jenense]MBB1125211.1 SUMF1/EgtB/PvdO family nonheme iron enzyme [Thiospirillum jenense]